MKLFFTNNLLRMTLLLTTMVLGASSAWAQIAMTRSTFSGAYTPITGTVTTATGDGAAATAIPIGFTFNYLGTPYTTLTAVTDGFLSFTATATSLSNSGLATTTAPNATLAPWWDDLTTSAIQYTTTGTPGSQVFTIQWTSLSYWTTSTRTINYQVKLYEGTNVIEFWYGAVSGTNTNANISESASIGIENTVGGPGNYIDAISGSSFIANGTLNSAQWPSLNFRFTPGAPTALAAGTYNVGAGQVYPTLWQAVADINHRGISGAITLNLTDATYTDKAAGGNEVFPIVFGPVAGTSAANTITVQGNAADLRYAGSTAGSWANGSATGTMFATTAEPILGVSGTDFLTVNNLKLTALTGIAIGTNTGTPTRVDRGLAMQNNTATNGATNNVFKNLSITLDRSNVNTMGIDQGQTVAATAQTGCNDNNTYQNFTIKNSYTGMSLGAGGVTFLDNNNKINTQTCSTYNIIGDPATPNDIGNTVSTNAIFGIRATGQSNMTIANCKIQNLTATSTGAIDGIYLPNAGSTTTSLGNCSIYNNFISAMNANNAAAAIISGLRINTTANAASVVRVYNNFVSGLSSTSTVTATRRIIGIRAQDIGTGVAGTISFDFNSVSINPAGIACSNACYELGTTSGATLKMRSNIFANTTAAQTGLAKHYCFVTTAATSIGATTVSNYNDLYVANANGFVGLGLTTDYLTLANWQTGVLTPAGTDANSISTNPNFAGANDLHVTALPLNGAADPLVATNAPWMTTAGDIDCQVRPQPSGNFDIGADEIDACTGTPTAGTLSGASVLCAGLGTTLTLSGASASAGISYQWYSSTTAGGPYTTALGTGLTQATGVLATTTYYVVSVTCSVSGLTATTPEKTITVTPQPMANVTPASATYCSPGVAIPIVAAATGGTGTLTYTWGPAAGLTTTTGTSVSASPNGTTTYIVTVTDTNGCTGTASSAITVAAGVSLTSVTATPSAFCPGGSSQLNATASLSPLVTVKITEVMFNRGGTGNTLALPAYAPGADIVEVSNISASPVDVSGWTISDYASASTTVSHPGFAFPAGTIIPANSVALVCLGTGTDDITNRYFNTGGINDSWASSSIWGVVLKAGTAVIDAVGIGTTISFAAGTGVTAADWTGVTAATAGFAGIIRTATTDNNVTADWTVASAALLQTIGAYNAGYVSPAVSAYSWTPATYLSATNIVNPMAAAVMTTTTYTVQATTSAGCTATGSVTLTIGANPLTNATITNTGAAAVCLGGTFTFDAAATGGCPNYKYELFEVGNPIALQTKTGVSTTTTSFTAITPAPAAGTHSYYVLVTDNNLATFSAASTTVTVNTLPVPTITGGNTCYAGSAVQLSATPAGMADYTWQPTFGGGLSDPFIQNPLASPTASTTYTVQVTDANGCTGTATTRIDFAVTLTPQNISICPGSTSLPIGVTGTCANTTGTITLTFPAAGITVLDVGTSSTIATFTMPALPAGAVATSIVLTANNTTTNTSSTIVWQNDLQLGLSGAATAALGTGVGALSSSSQSAPGWNYTRTTTPGAVSAAGGVVNLIYTSYNSTGQDHYFPNGVTAVINYTYPAAINWFTTATGGSSIATGNTMDPVATVGSGLTNTNTLGTTTYYAGCSNAPNCRQAVTFTVANAALGAATITSSVPAVCPTGTFTFTGGITGGCSPYTYKLFEQGNASALQTKTAISSTTTAFTAIAPTVGTHTYYVEVTDAGGATATAADIVVTVNPYPTVTAAPATSCFSTAAVALTAAGASTYAWSPAAGLSATTGTTTNASPAQSTTYMVTGTDVNGCTATAMVQVDKMPFTTANNGVVCQGSTAPLLSTVGTCPNTTGTITLTFPAAGITVPDVGSNSTIATFTMPALPVGAVATSIVLTANNTTTNPGSTGVWQSDLQLGLSGAATAALGTGAGSTSIAAQNAPGWNYIRTTTPGAVSAAGGVVNLVYTSFNSAGQDHFFPNGVTAVISYSAPASQEWFTAATGGAAFATGTSVQIVGTAALANTNTAGTTTVYTGCTNAVNCRFPVTLTVNEAATVNAGVDKFTCEDAAPTAIVLGDATINAAAATGTWSIVAGGTVAGTLSSTAAEAVPSTVTFTPAANAHGTVTLRLTTADPDGTGPCLAATDDVLVTVYQKPILVLTGTTGCVAGGVDLNTFINAAGSTFPATAAGTTFNFFEADMTTPVADPSLVSTAGTYYIQAVSDAANGSCASLLKPVTLTDGPVFTLTALAAAARPCIGTPVTLNASPILTETPAVGETITYTVEDPANVITSGVTLAGAPYSITQCPAPSPALGVYTFTATSSLTGCSSVGQVTMTFKQTPVLTTTAPAAVCFPSTVNITTPAVRLAVNSPVSPSSAITYSYYATAAAAAAGTPVITPAAAAVLAAPSNPGNTPYTATYYVRAQLANGCKDIDPVAITINGTPVGTVLTGNAQTVCGGTTPTFSGMTFGTSNAMPATTFTWTRDKTTQVTGLAASGSGNIAAATLVNTTAVAQTVTFTVTPMNPASTPACTGTPFTATLIVNPDVAAPSAVTPYAMCVGTTPAAGAGVKASCGGGNVTLNFTPTIPDVASTATNVASTTMAALPAGAVITSVIFRANNTTTNPNSTLVWQSDLNLSLTGAVTAAAATGTGALSSASQTAPGWNYTRTLPTSAVNAAGGTVNLLYNSFNSTGPDHFFPNGVQVLIAYDFPATLSYYASPTGTDLLGTSASGTGYNPIGVTAAGAAAPLVANNTTPGVYTLYAACPGCGTNRTPVTFSINALPVAAISPASPVNVCVGGSQTFTASGGTGYVWSNSFGTTPAITLNFNLVSTGNIFTVTVTDANACTNTATTLVNINALPTPNITSSGGTLVCSGTPLTLNAGVAGATYAWNTGGTGQTITDSPTANTTYTVTITNPAALGACTATGSITIQVVSAPTIASLAATPATFCGSGSSSLLATASTTPAIINSTFAGAGCIINTSGISAPHPVALNVSGLPTTGVTVKSVTLNGIVHTFAGDVDVFLRSPTAQDVILLTDVGSFDGFDVATTLTLQDGSPALPTASGAIAAGTYACTNGGSYSGTTPAPVGTSTTLSTFTGNPNGTWNLYVFDDAGGDGGSLGSFSITFNVPNNLTYTWTGGLSTTNAATTPTITATTPYTVTVTNIAGCTATRSVTVTVNPLPTPTITGTPAFCVGGNTTLTATGGTSYLWSNGVVVAANTVSAIGTYTVTVTDGNGCTASTTVSVTQNALPVATLTKSSNLTCAVTTVTLTAATGTMFNFGTGFTATPTFDVTAAGTYMVTVQNAAGCTATASVGVTANTTAPVANVMGNLFFCTGASTTLSASPGFATYAWSGGTASTATNKRVFNTAGTFSVVITGANGCSTTKTFVIVENTKPVISGVTVPSTCQGSPLTGAVTVTSVLPATTTWTASGFTATGLSITRSPATTAMSGLYIVRSANSCGTTTTSVNALVKATVPVTVAINNASTLGGNTGYINVTVPAGCSISWADNAGITVGSRTGLAAGVYTVTVTPPAGSPYCPVTRAIQVN
jgi:large repetitive protein